MPHLLHEPYPIHEGTDEPAPGTVIMAHGLDGTAWQRLYADGRYHRAAPGVPSVDWEYFLARARARQITRTSADLIVVMGGGE